MHVVLLHSDGAYRAKKFINKKNHGRRWRQQAGAKCLQ